MKKESPTTPLPAQWPNQAHTMSICISSARDGGHWYSPEAVRERIDAAVAEEKKKWVAALLNALDGAKQKSETETTCESIRRAWERLQPEECFFVPCLDELEAKKILLSMSYIQGKYQPVCKTGILRGRFGILCRRSTNPSRERPDTDRQLWFG